MSRRSKPRGLRLRNQGERLLLITVIEQAVTKGIDRQDKAVCDRWLAQLHAATQAATPAQVDDLPGREEQRSQKVLQLDGTPFVQASVADTVREIFDHWRVTMDGSGSRLDSPRRRVIEKRLAEGYTQGQLMQAISGCEKSAWHMGDNPDGKRYNHLTLILRDAEHIERFASYATFPPRPRSQAAQRLARNVDAAQAFLAKTDPIAGDAGSKS